MVRWGHIPEQKADDWYHEMAKNIYRPDVYERAGKMLVAEGKAETSDFPFATDGYRAPSTDFIDGNSYDGRQPVDYVNSFSIGLK